MPICARVPSLKERTPEEREDLILSFLRSEGCRIGSDVKISRGAYRCLVNADFSDNIAGLRACVTNCCAKAFLNREGDYVVVRPYLLPSGLLSSAQIDQQPDDGVLIDASLDAAESTGPVEQALDACAPSMSDSAPGSSLSPSLSRKLSPLCAALRIT